MPNKRRSAANKPNSSPLHNFENQMNAMNMHMRTQMNAMNMQMRSMNRLMSHMPDPFQMMQPLDVGFPQNAIMERAHHGHQMAPMGGLFGFPPMPNMNRLLSADIGAPNGGSFCSSSVISMSSGPDGRPQIYQATSSTKTGPNGVRETRKTVQDSTKGIKKMAIGHHIGERAHIIEKEQDLRSGQLEERQEFINLDEEEAENFDREFTTKVRYGPGGVIINGGGAIGHRARPHQQALTITPIDDDEDDDVQEVVTNRQLPALPAPTSAAEPQQQQLPQNSSNNNLSNANANDASSNDNSNTANITTPISSSSINRSNDHDNNAHTGASPRRIYRNHHHHLHNMMGATPRRPLRSPMSSPLATTPTLHTNITAAAPSSVHPHPYNPAAARRNYRAKHGSSKPQQQSEQQQQQTINATAGAGSPTTKSKNPKKDHHHGKGDVQ